MPQRLPTLAPTLLIFERRLGGSGGAFSLSGKELVELDKELVEVLTLNVLALFPFVIVGRVGVGGSSSQTRSMTPARMKAQSEQVVRNRARHQPELHIA